MSGAAGCCHASEGGKLYLPVGQKMQIIDLYYIYRYKL